MGNAFPAASTVQWSSHAHGSVQCLCKPVVGMGRELTLLGRGGVESRHPVHQAKEQRLDVVSVSWLLIYQCPVTRK